MATTSLPTRWSARRRRREPYKTTHTCIGVGGDGMRASPRAPQHERRFRARLSSPACGHPVKLCPTGSQLAFGETRLKPFLFHSEKNAAKWLRGSTPFIDFDPTERVIAHL